MSDQITVVALGNSNNLAWGILFSLARNYRARCSLVMLNKGKLRDCPPLIEAGIRVTTFPNLPEPSQLMEPVGSLHVDLLKADAILISGEFFAIAAQLRAHVKRSCLFLAIPIGFDVETLMFHFSKSKNINEVAFSDRMRIGLSECDWAAQNDNTSDIARAELVAAGLWERRPEVWRDLNPIRITLAQALLSHSSSFNPEIGPVTIDQRAFDFAERSIFVASRITADDPRSVGAKGSQDLFEWIASQASWLGSQGVGVLLINRDDLSRSFIDRLRKQTKGTALRIGVVQELNYVLFLRVLASSLLAVDSFDFENRLRPHMTTSDAISVGTPVITSLGRTKRDITILTDPAVKISTANDARKLIEDRLAVRQETALNRAELAQQHLARSHRTFTDVGESEAIVGLATGRKQ